MNKILKSLLFIVMVIISSLYLVSCNGKTGEPSEDFSLSKPEESISKFFYSIKTGDLITAAQYLDKSDKSFNVDLKFNSQTQEKIIKEVFARTDYKIISSSYRSNKAEVLIEITSPDLLSIYNEMNAKLMKPIIDKYLNGNEKEKAEAKNEGKKLGMKYLMDVLNSGSYPKTTNKVKLKLMKTGDKWILIMNEDFIYALTGRMPQLL